MFPQAQLKYCFQFGMEDLNNKNLKKNKLCVYKIKVNFKLQANLGKAFKRMKRSIPCIKPEKYPRRFPKAL